MSNYPTSNPIKRDWDKIEKEIVQEDHEENMQHDPMYFLRDLANGNPDVKRAYEKSFIESGGKSLSSNWNEVKNGTFTGEKS